MLARFEQLSWYGNYSCRLDSKQLPNMSVCLLRAPLLLVTPARLQHRNSTQMSGITSSERTIPLALHEAWPHEYNATRRCRYSTGKPLSLKPWGTGRVFIFCTCEASTIGGLGAF